MNASWDLRQLECFLAVAEERHFRKAAERLHLSPASVSEAIAGLERRLGGRLFDRSTRRVRLTAHGARFLDDVQEPYEQLRRAHEFARARSKGRDRIAIAYTPELGHLFLPSLLARSPSSESSTAVAFRPSLVHTAQQIREIEDGAIDIGLCWSPAVQPPLTAVPLCKIPVVAVLCEDDPLAAYSAIPLGVLLSRRVLVVSRHDNPFIEARRRTSFVQAGVIAPDVEEVLRYDELAVHVATGDRVGLHPATLALTNRIPGVVFRRVIEPSLFETICVLTRVPTRHPDVDAVLATLARVATELDGDRLRSLLSPDPTTPVQLTA